MSLQQFSAILAEIQANHRFGVSCSNKKSNHIKYVRPNIDMRGDRVFSITFKAFVAEVTFDFRDSAEPMYDRIMAWLNGEGD